MVDEQPNHPETEAAGAPLSDPAETPEFEESEESDQPEKRHPLSGAVIAAIVIVLIVLVLLMLRGCGADDSSSSTTGGGKSIVPVGGLPPQRGAISVWVDEGASIDIVLAAASVRGSDVVNMGGGRYVVAVPVGTERGAVRRLTGIDGVADAGRVYTTEDRR